MDVQGLLGTGMIGLGMEVMCDVCMTVYVDHILNNTQVHPPALRCSCEPWLVTSV